MFYLLVIFFLVVVFLVFGGIVYVLMHTSPDGGTRGRVVEVSTLNGV